MPGVERRAGLGTVDDAALARRLGEAEYEIAADFLDRGQLAGLCGRGILAGADEGQHFEVFDARVIGIRRIGGIAAVRRGTEPCLSPV